MAGERGDVTPPSDNHDRPSSSEGNQSERQARSENQQRRGREREQQENADQRRQRDVREPDKSHTERASDEEGARAENLGETSQAAEHARSQLLQRLIDEAVRRLPKEDFEKISRGELPNSDDYRTLRNFLNTLEAMTQRQIEQQQDARDFPTASARILSKYNETEAVRRTLGLVDVMHAVYEQAVLKADAAGLDLEAIKKAGDDAVRGLVEQQLAAIEEDDTGVRQEDVAALQQAINITIVDDVFRAELARRAVARSWLHYGAFTSKYIGGEQWSQVPTNLLEMHMREVVEKTTGVKEAVLLLEAPDKNGSKGEYYREPEIAELDESKPYIKAILDFERKEAGGNLNKDQIKDIKQKVWVVEMRFTLIQQARQKGTNEANLRNVSDFSNGEADDTLIKLGLYELQGKDPVIKKMNTPKIVAETALKRDFQSIYESHFPQGEEQKAQTAEKRQKFTTLLYDTHRAFELATRIHHISGQSALYDGPRWKAGTKIPEGYVHAGEIANDNQLIEPDPVYEVKDPGDPDTGEGAGIMRKIHLREPEIDAKNDPVLKRTLDAFRESDLGQRYKMAIQWTQANHALYRDNWKDIDFDKSAKSGRAARMSNRILNFPSILQHPSEVHAGKAKFLRRFTYLGVPSLMQMSGYSSAIELVENWDDQYRIMKEGWVGRLAGAEKLKAQINRKDPDMINSHKGLKEFVKSLSSMKPTMKEYMTPEEVGATVENWLRGLLEFRAMHSDEVALLNLTKEGVEHEIDHAQMEGLIDDHKSEKIKHDLFAPKALLKLSESKPFSPEHYPGKAIWKLWEFSESTIESIKGLWWSMGIWTFIKEFFKQAFTPPK